MEKGNQRTSSSKPGTSSDTKNKYKQDAANKYTRWPRFKSEVNSSRFETRPKPIPQKSRETLDKRPRTRGGVVCERYRNEVTEEDSFGKGKQGSKKRSPNLLLDYTIADSHERDFVNRRPSKGHRARIPKHTKEQYLRANCVFIAREGGDYSVHCKNPDHSVNWSFVEEVRVPSFEVPSCPICLYPPVAAKITLCGHIYCWACILHYLAICDEPKQQKCPICEELIHKADLRSVLPLTVMPVSVGNTLRMCLMKRAKSYMFPVPVGHDSSLSLYHVQDVDSVTKYQKLLLASTSDVFKIIERERKELENQLLDEVDEYEAHYVQAALMLLQERAVKSSDNDSTNISSPESIPGGLNASLSFDVGNGNIASSPENEFRQDNFHKISESSEDSHCPTNVLSDPENNEGYVYFYQSDDGQHVYLHSLNIRMLIKQFGSLENCPPVIEGSVLQLEKMSITEALRDRLKYLKHVPITCEFHYAELNLDYLLRAETIKEFKGEVVKRQKLRNKKASEERKREKHIQEMENRKLGKYPSATYNLKSPEQFPACVATNEVLEPSPSSPEDYETQYPSFGLSNLTIKEEPGTSPNPTTFAQLLCNGQVNFNLAVPQKNAPEKKLPANPPEETNSDEEAEKIPEYKQSFSNAIQAALDKAVLNENPTGCKTSKKKKIKSRVLFTTSMCRSK